MEARRGCLNLLLTFALVVSLVVGWLGAAPVARAADNGLVVTQNTARSEFPRDVVFSLQAQSPDQVAQARLLYRLADDPVTYSDLVPVSPNVRVSASFTMDLQQRYLPPGVVITYQWLLDGQSGATFATPWASVTVTDPRFAWQTVTKGPLTLHWYDGDTAFANAVLADGVNSYLKAAKTAGAQTLPRGDIYLYASDTDLRGALAQGTDTWVGGQTFPRYHVIVLLGPSAQAAQVDRDLSHEVTHLAVDGATMELAPLPTWLDEGMAMAAEGSSEPAYQTALTDAAHADQLLSLQSLSANFPEDPNQALVAYAESESLVNYFTQQYGQERLARLVDAYRHGQTADQAFQNSAGVSAKQFEAAWRQSVGAAPIASSGGSPLVRTLSGPIDFISAVIRGLIDDFSSPKLKPASP
ncbi:MAG TPA: peptidase MA family metallohydrolase [Chloroflexota bacterium]|nr:peptidase MA family metallohydrolase [Chloroflexota bacterium]